MDEINARSCIRRVQDLSGGTVLIIGGTTGTMLKMAEELDGSARYRDQPGRFQVGTLIVDEASMMVFPHFLALATLVGPQGEMMLAGDHRQLAPIMAHDWEREDRPPVMLYQPYASAYDAVRNIARSGMTEDRVRPTHLRYTFRLPAVVRELLSQLYQLDNIDLDGAPAAAPVAPPVGVSTWERIWRDGRGLYLVMHSEKRSTNSNAVEGEVIQRILAGAGPLPPNSTAIVTPHRAQRNLLGQRLAEFAGPQGPVGVIDTVEKLQGGERANIIVSASQSDPASIAARVEFILDLNRSNVAFSRTQERLIVVCSDSLLDHIPPEVDQYTSTMLWKSLREICSEVIGVEEVDGVRVAVLTPPLARPAVDPAAEAA